ncbi:hypothetical protein DdX_13777 [Ditylenchus destructor]|uniref:Uncharacterized protein n=1 Tax=Ditylenchus destructor TaxID=166010 RepID=A0AAD4MS91_9BILA|nr:hypothetical protein DdX_13777 [Ditylenchus destructor]
MDFHSVPTHDEPDSPGYYNRKTHSVKNLFLGFAFGVLLVLSSVLLSHYYRDYKQREPDTMQSLPLRGEKQQIIDMLPEKKIEKVDLTEEELESWIIFQAYFKKSYNTTEELADAQERFVENYHSAGWSISPITGLPNGINNDSDAIYQGPRPKLVPFEIDPALLHYVADEDPFTGPLPENYLVDTRWDGPFRTNKKIIYSPRELLDCFSKHGCSGEKSEEVIGLNAWDD